MAATEATMVYDVYAVFPEGNYLVASGTHREDCADFAEQVCRDLGQWPRGFATLTRGEHVIRGNLFSVADLKKRKKDEKTS